MKQPMLTTQVGGHDGGGAKLTQAARDTIRSYAAAAANARKSAFEEFSSLS